MIGRKPKDSPVLTKIQRRAKRLSTPDLELYSEQYVASIWKHLDEFGRDRGTDAVAFAKEETDTLLALLTELYNRVEPE